MALKNIKGRKKEIGELQRAYSSKRSEFVALCGRRRIGKTFLVNEFFSGKFSFTVSGIANGTMRNQLHTFNNEISAQFPSVKCKKATNWLDAFFNLRACLESSKVKRKVVFIDELPWMDTPKSGFIPALENFWNGWACLRHDIVLVVCGSSTSWMMDKLINSKGGLHNRLTYSLFLEPFTLGESEEMLKGQGLNLSRYEMCICYMVFGGIPYYLSFLRPEMSLSQNIDSLLFSRGGELYNEFDNLYSALFKNSEDYIEVVKALTTERGGLTREEITKKTGIVSGGSLSKILKNLEKCGFIRRYVNIAHGKPVVYQLIDFYTLFYFHFIASKVETLDENYWMSLQDTPGFYNWAGLTFELLCLSHMRQIKHKLNINGGVRVFGWRTRDSKGGAQVDLIIMRKDMTVNICEAKFSKNKFLIDKDEDMRLRNRVESFRKALDNPAYSLRLTMITSHGLSQGKYNAIVSDQLVANDLFEDVGL